mmetsp:Transcript_321/g.982  ORF Transcript_321/g.982 Transcript_321/m.982 type:complete len:584 (-) Transcript_321:126-1877(-)
MLRSLLEMPSGLELHIGMWIPTLEAMCTAEQRERWLSPSRSFQIIGTYAQTELGHGSNLRGLQTTATYDKESESFILHTPTLTASKWWPGGLGKTATHAVVMARLFLEGRDLGPHPFVVQLRSLENHKPLAGIAVGDLGPKLGYQGVDNGFLRLDHVRVDRGSMLSRFSSVTPDGQYVPPAKGNEKSSYSTLIFVRATLVRDAAVNLAKATTIATRYNAVRRQGGGSAGRPEEQVLDYSSQYATLLPLISTAYSLAFMGKSLMDLYRKFEKDRDANDFSLLPELHQLTAGMKAISTWDAATGIERCRYSCGGNGFLESSGLPRLLTYYLQNPTWDGENSVMSLQTARYLLKCLTTARRQKPIHGSAAYIEAFLSKPTAKCSATCSEDFSNLRVLLLALQHRAARQIACCAHLLSSEEAACGGDTEAAWNRCTSELVLTARAHLEAATAANFMEMQQQLSSAGAISPHLSQVLKRLAVLQSLNVMKERMGDFLMDGYMSGEQAQMALLQWREHLQLLRPDAVALVDSFGFDDYELHDSAIGRYDGDVYRELAERAAASPLNSTEEGPAYYPVLRSRIGYGLSKL